MPRYNLQEQGAYIVEDRQEISLCKQALRILLHYVRILPAM